MMNSGSLKNTLVLLKVIFIVLSISIYLFSKTKSFTLEMHINWRDFNEFMFYFLFVLLLSELILLSSKKKGVYLTLICIVTTYLFEQNLFPTGTNLDKLIWSISQSLN